jgi:hypothetical protein
VPRKLSSDRVADELDALLVLEFAEAEAGESGFAAHALGRIAARDGQGEKLDLRRVIHELAQSVADVGSWGVLSLQALDHAVDAASPHRQFIESALRAAVVFAALTYKALILAQDHLPAEADR